MSDSPSNPPPDSSHAPQTTRSTGKQWHFWVDRGGTFTDIVAVDPEGRFATRKLLSENPEAYEDAALQGIRDFLGAEGDAAIPGHRIDSVKMGTTVATNALLERDGEPTVLAITKGLKDVLEIGYPVMLEEFSIARGTGGKGRWTAGDGVYQRIRFLGEMECAILSGHRKVAPFGTDGGAREDLGGCGHTVMHPGDAIVIETPTGGGFGTP